MKAVQLLTVMGLLVLSSFVQAKELKLQCRITEKTFQGSKSVVRSKAVTNGLATLDLGEFAPGVQVSVTYSSQMSEPFAISIHDGEKMISSRGVIGVYAGVAGNGQSDPDIDFSCGFQPLY